MFIEDNAERFLNAYRVLTESNSILLGDSSSLPDGIVKGEAFGTLNTMGVDVVCLSFSVELFIKNLHYALTNEAPRGHRISALFDKLPDDVKQDIFTYPSIAKYGWNFEEFNKEIDAVSDGFEKWRYSHEHSALNYNLYFALVFIEALRFVAQNRVSIA